MIKKASDVFNVPGLRLDDSAPSVRSHGRHPIVVALDGTSAAERSLPIAVALAKRWDAPLRLAHISSPVVGLHNTDHFLIDNGESVSVQSREGMYLESLAETIGDSTGLSVRCKTISGIAIADSLRSICERYRPRVLVMARPRRSRLSRLLFGSVSNRLIGHLAAPLLLVPAEGNVEHRPFDRPSELNRILVHLDGTDTSERVLDLAIGIASKNTVCHLRRVVPVASLYSPMNGNSTASLDVRDKAWHELLYARNRLVRHGIDCTTRLIFDSGNSASAIVAEAKAMQSLVVLPAPRKHRLPGWLKPDVTSHFVREADVPMLMAPEFGGFIPPATDHAESESDFDNVPAAT